MLVALRAIRSFVSMVLVGAYFTLGSIVLRLGVLPAVWLWPGLRFPVTSVYMRTMARGIFALQLRQMNFPDADPPTGTGSETHTGSTGDGLTWWQRWWQNWWNR